MSPDWNDGLRDRLCWVSIEGMPRHYGSRGMATQNYFLNAFKMVHSKGCSNLFTGKRGNFEWGGLEKQLHTSHHIPGEHCIVIAVFSHFYFIVPLCLSPIICTCVYFGIKLRHMTVTSHDSHHSCWVSVTPLNLSPRWRQHIICLSEMTPALLCFLVYQNDAIPSLNCIPIYTM